MWKLAQKTIDIIRQAEQEADQLEKDTAAECESIVQAAREQAARHFEITTDQSRASAKEILESARQKGDEIIARQLQQAEVIAADLRKAAAEKEQEAIRMIISKLY